MRNIYEKYKIYIYIYFYINSYILLFIYYLAEWYMGGCWKLTQKSVSQSYMYIIYFYILIEKVVYVSTLYIHV